MLYGIIGKISVIEKGRRTNGFRYLVAAHAVGSADHDGASVPGARDAEVFRIPQSRPGPHSVARCPRLARARRRIADPDRAIPSTGSLHSRRRHGRRLLLRARAERLLSSVNGGRLAILYLL